jgi:hypothetical protein
MELAPIALFVYNRPDHTKQTVESLQKNALSKESELFIFSDGPKNDAAKKQVMEVRDYIKTISGFKRVNIIEKEKNSGLANSIIAGVTELCERFGSVIVLEDDLIVSPHFLEYMNAALERYEKNERVMQISGFMFPVELKALTDAVFLPFTSSWGWATWQRAWQQFDPEMKGYDNLHANPALRRRFDLDGSYPYYKMLEAQRRGRIDSWAIRWYLSVFIAGGLVLHPARSLVCNGGFDNSGIHCCSSNMPFITPLCDIRVIKFPVRPELARREYEICKSFLNSLNLTLVGRMKELFNEFVKISI